ncbi:MAG TPA: DUF2157 domain-containing protein [Longimicrobiales bacterium]|nr:DUF2157 domain-containing protein [Longimicrobiales bacterium]
MAHDGGPVYQAIERWEDKSLISPELAARLRDEVTESAAVGTARMTQYLVAATGAVVLLIASGVFLDWVWPRMGEVARAGLLAGAGIVVHLWGARLETKRRWIPAALLMQTAGLGLLLAAFVYSENAWPDRSAGAVGTGLAALVIPLMLAPHSFRANAVMPAVHLCFGLGFLSLFLDRATPLSSDAIIWVLDGVLLVASLIMVDILRRDPDSNRHPWALNAFVAAVYAAAVLAVLTGIGPLDLQDKTLYPLDAWLALVVALALWGIHGAPPGLRKEWFEAQLAYAVLLWIPLGFGTALEAMDGPPTLALVLVGGVAVVGFAYAMRVRSRRIMATSALAFVSAVWYWAVQIGGALGAVAGLVFAAGFLFWLSGRVGAWAAPDSTA